AALGMGFMFVEISMMQKMIIFLGHPTYALSVVLASILGFAGLGSLVSGRLPLLRRRNLHLLTAIIVVLIIVTGLVVRLLLPHLLGFSLAARIAMAVIILMPTAFVLGMPFPLGIRMLERRCPQLLPWGWAINGFLSVFSSIFCVVLSMAIGFTWVFLLAAAVYLLGMLAVSRRLE
ncbi:MAG: SAM-dependent methyltransferase, partial [Planctomycetota bacterium]